MPDRPSFPIPETLEPDTYCLCIPIPNDPIWKQVIAGLLFQPAEWYNWQRDDARSGKVLAHFWREIYNNIDWSTMSCCCPEPEPLQVRFTSEGHYQTSSDGVTWTDAPTQDPRWSSPQAPPLPNPDEEDFKCRYADGVVNVFKDQFVQSSELGDTIEQITALIFGILSGLLGAVAAPLLYVIYAALAPAIIAIGVEAFQAAFTDDVWNRFRCLIYEHIQSDGSFTQADIDAIYAGIDETGIAAFTLTTVVATMGTVGMTNAARTGNGSPDADCNCSDGCAVLFDVQEGYGIVIDRDDNSVTVEATFDPVFSRYTIILETSGMAECCNIHNYEDIVGTLPFTNYYYKGCGSNDLTPVGIDGDIDVWTLYTFGGSPFTVKFNFNPI